MTRKVVMSKLLNIFNDRGKVVSLKVLLTPLDACSKAMQDEFVHSVYGEWLGLHNIHKRKGAIGRNLRRGVAENAIRRVQCL